MRWTIKLSNKTSRAIEKLDSIARKKIVKFISQTLPAMDNPRQTGKSLQGTELGNYWRYRVGDYRLICEIIDNEITILVVEIGHRSKIYKSH